MSDVSPSMAEIGFLRRLDAGVDFAAAVTACGSAGVKISFNCILNGWVDRGRITPSGRAMVMPTLTLLPPPDRSR